MHHKTHQKDNQKLLNNRSQQECTGTTAPQGQPCQGLTAGDGDLITNHDSTHEVDGASKESRTRERVLDDQVSGEGTKSSNRVIVKSGV